MINQYILLNRYKIDTQNPNYQNITPEIIQIIGNVDEFDVENYILEQYNAIWKYILEKTSPEKTFKAKKTLPRKFGLLAGIIIRFAFQDKSINKEFILKVLQAIEKRNQSIYAHGIDSIGKNDCEKLKKISEKMISVVNIEQKYKVQVFNQKSLKNLADLFIRVF